MVTSPNRLSTGIEKCKAVLKARLESGELTQEKLNEANALLDMDMDMFVQLQNEKSLAMMDGRLSEDEALLAYMYLGESPSTFNSQPIEVKIVMNEMFATILRSRIG